MSDFEKARFQIEKVLKEHFGELTEIHVFPGQLTNIHVWVASPFFETTPEYMRLDRVWKVLDKELNEIEKVRISLVLCFDPNEPEYQWALAEQEKSVG